METLKRMLRTILTLIYEFVNYLFSNRISDIGMGTAVVTDTGRGRAVLVEECACPTGYQGTSCEVRHLPRVSFLEQPWCPGFS